MRTRMLVFALVSALLGFSGSSVSATQTGTEVRGNYVNYGPGAVLTGGFIGLTIAAADAGVDEEGNVSGTFDEWFYGRHGVLGPHGGLHYTGTFSINTTTAAFLAEGTIVGGTCRFAGSTGTIRFTGNAVTGSYHADLILGTPVPALTCIPVAL